MVRETTNLAGRLNGAQGWSVPGESLQRHGDDEDSFFGGNLLMSGRDCEHLELLKVALGKNYYRWDLKITYISLIVLAPEGSVCFPHETH